MRICIVGLKSQRLDEGVRKVDHHLALGLSGRHDVLFADVRESLTPGFWRRVRGFGPDIIQGATSASLPGFVLMRLLALLNPRSRTAMLVLQPSAYFRVWAPLISRLRPHLIIAQSPAMQRRLRGLGGRVELLANGVDLDRFRPVSLETRLSLRRKYGVPADRIVLLHVGPLTKGRNLALLGGLQGERCQVLVVGSTSLGADGGLCRELERRGCLVWRDYFPEIQEVYALSDGYVFPTTEAGESIELPLSVLEAMACNLPVFATRYGGLPHLFPGGDGLFFVDRPAELTACVRAVDWGRVRVNTRASVEPYSWGSVVARLEGIYQELVAGREGGG